MKRFVWFLIAVLLAAGLGGIWYLWCFKLHPMDPGMGCDQHNVVAAKKAVVKALAWRIRVGMVMALLSGAIIAFAVYYLQLFHSRKTTGAFWRWFVASLCALLVVRLGWMSRALQWALSRTRSCLEEALSDPSTAQLVPIKGLQFHLAWTDAVHVQCFLAMVLGMLLGFGAYLVARKSARA